ncbi:MAG: undecaprenyl-phosphate glucose phosphotransferase, partial [Pannonibacter indicus]
MTTDSTTPPLSQAAAPLEGPARAADDAESLRKRLAEELRRSDTAADATRASSGSGTALSPAAEEIARSLRSDGISQPVLEGSVRLLDVIIVAATGFASLSFSGTPFTALTFGAVAAALFFTLAFFQGFDAYQVRVLRSGLAQTGRIAGGWTLVLAMFAIAFVTTDLPRHIAPQAAGLWYASGLFGLVVSRLILSRLVSSWIRSGRLERRAVIVGGGQAAADLIHEL